MSELKACPFCGIVPELKMGELEYTTAGFIGRASRLKDGWWIPCFIKCMNFNCKTRPHTFGSTHLKPFKPEQDVRKYDLERMIVDAKQEAIKQWNTRPAPERHNELREALEAAVKALDLIADRTDQKSIRCIVNGPLGTIARAALAEQAAPVKEGV